MDYFFMRARDGDMMHNKRERKEIRRTLMIYLDCHEILSGREIGKVIDITRDGFMLMSNIPMKIGHMVEFKIKLPASEIFTHKELTGQAVCRWFRKEENRDLYYMGMSFADITSEHDDVVDLLIMRIGFSNGQKKIFTTAGDIVFK